MTIDEIGTRFFRAGVGTVIYNNNREVALFQRAKHPVGVWQFQQGGIDLGEQPEETLWRELFEEVGVIKDEVESVVEYPRWTVYQDANSLTDNGKSRLGQAHRWFFVQLKTDTEIDLEKAPDQEASDYRWTTFDEAISVTDDLKKHVYQELREYFEEHIR